MLVIYDGECWLLELERWGCRCSAKPSGFVFDSDRESSPSAVTDVENLHSLGPLLHAIDYAIDMRLVAVKKMPELLVLRNRRASGGMFFQTQDRAFKTFVPSKSRYRFGCVNVFEEQFQITLGSGHETNEISHTFA
jgi:hypothetical protein